MTYTLIILLMLLMALPANAQNPPKKSVRAAKPPAPLVLAPASDEQLVVTAMTYFGDYVCESKQSLQVRANPRFDGYVDVHVGKQLHTMKPVLSLTGALRLEDVRGRLLLLQIPVKSMLLDVQTGHRLNDECVHEKQAENRRSLPSGSVQPDLGIEPSPRVDDAAGPEAAASAAAAPNVSAPAAASAPMTPTTGSR